MNIGRRKLTALVSGVLVVVLAVAGWAIGGTDLLLAVVLVTLVVGVGLVGYMMAQTERRLRADARAEIQRASTSGGSTITERVEELRGSIAGLEAALDRKLQRPAEQAEALLRAINAAYRRLEMEQKENYKRLAENQTVHFDRHISSFAKQTVLHNHAPAEIDALLQVHRRLQLDDPLPLMGGYALSPRGMLQAIELAGQPGVSLVVECGSGTSTLFMARALQLQGEGAKKLVALEHFPEFFEQTNATIKRHGLDNIADLRYAPLEEVEVDGEPFIWYSLAAIADLADIDLLVVDGPPGSTGQSARYPAYPLLRDKLAPQAVILVDDAERKAEREMVDWWLGMGGLTEHRGLGPKQLLLRVSDRAS